ENLAQFGQRVSVLPLRHRVGDKRLDSRLEIHDCALPGYFNRSASVAPRRHSHTTSRYPPSFASTRTPRPAHTAHGTVLFCCENSQLTGLVTMPLIPHASLRRCAVRGLTFAP